MTETQCTPGRMATTKYPMVAAAVCACSKILAKQPCLQVVYQIILIFYD